MSETSPNLKTLREIAAGSRLSVRTLHRLIAAGQLPAHRIGRSVRVSETDWQAFLSRRSGAGRHGQAARATGSS
ncbi:MAG: helix-turn-helix domain-containing protein [Ferrovibrio sp.]